MKGEKKENRRENNISSSSFLSIPLSFINSSSSYPLTRKQYQEK